MCFAIKPFLQAAYDGRNKVGQVHHQTKIRVEPVAAVLIEISSQIRWSVWFINSRSSRQSSLAATCVMAKIKFTSFSFNKSTREKRTTCCVNVPGRPDYFFCCFLLHLFSYFYFIHFESFDFLSRDSLKSKIKHKETFLEPNIAWLRSIIFFHEFWRPANMRNEGCEEWSRIK